MAYALLILEPHGQRAERSREQGEAAFAAMLQFGESLRERGQLLAMESLSADAQGARVRQRDGQVRIVDGPFAESKEMIGGFFLIDCASREQALAIAAECPAAAWATVEVRETGPCYR